MKNRDRVCAICGRVFTPAAGSVATTCSRACWSILMSKNAYHRPAKKHTHICEHCGEKFTVTGYSVKKTCSEECKLQLIAKKVAKTLLDRYGNVIHKVCPICGKEFTCKRFAERSYCSRSCANRARGRNSETCVICGKTFCKPASQQAKVCSEKCLKRYFQQRGKKQDLSAMREGQKSSPRTSSTPENWRAKEWSLRAPDGTVFQFKNLNYFVRKNKAMFPAHLLVERNFTPVIASFLARLAPWRKTRKKRCLSVHGWTWAE